MRADQRAWLVPTSASVNTKDGEVIYQNFTYTNIGRTPAKHIRGNFAMEWVGWNGTPNFNYSISDHASNAVYPNHGSTLGIPLLADIQGTSTRQPVKYTDDIKTKFMNQEMVFVLHGRLTYMDIFDTSHWIQYCVLTRGLSKSGMFNDSTAAQKCEEYNDTDK
jgi:hypothetical protein